MRLLIVGRRDGTHIGGAFARAAQRLGHEVDFADAALAYHGNQIASKLAWHFAGRRPLRLRSFSDGIVSLARSHLPACVIATGIAPIDARSIEQLAQEGIPVMNFLTDDPWNPAHHAPWFMKALCRYSCVFTPRRANISDLSGLGLRRVRYLPFGYDEELFYPDSAGALASGEAERSDVVFAGGADASRIPYMKALFDANFDLALYGGFWDRFPVTRGRSRGVADPQLLRRVLSAAKIGLCLVRRQNRDGNCMRTFEVPAVGTCMLAEDTDEHREIFGPDGEAIAYFNSPGELIARAKHLLHDEHERQRLARAAYELVTSRGHSYRERLKVMLEAVPVHHG